MWIRVRVMGLAVRFFMGTGRGTELRIRYIRCGTLLRRSSSQPDRLDGDEAIRCPDIEIGHPMAKGTHLGEAYFEKRASPYYKERLSDGGEDGKLRGWRGKVNRAVYAMANKWAVLSYDEVAGADDGLLLPVRDGEREEGEGVLTE